jgi:hypothetical protein
MRGSAISFWTLTSVVLLVSFLCLLLFMDSFRDFVTNGRPLNFQMPSIRGQIISNGGID